MIDGIQPVVGAQTPHHAAVTVERPAPAVEVSTSAPQTNSAPAAIYYSPAVQIDHEANMAIFVVRNSETGAVINQYPSKRVVEEYKRTDAKKTEEAIRPEHHEAKNDAPTPEVKHVEAVAAPIKPVVKDDKPAPSVTTTA